MRMTVEMFVFCGQDIAGDAWLRQDWPGVQPADYLPLVSREHLTEDDHALILQKMAQGHIATKEQILDALDKNEYNNITATYFLLAERKVRPCLVVVRSLETVGEGKENNLSTGTFCWMFCS